MRKIKTSQLRKLTLSSETLRQLTPVQLAGVAGGLMPTFSYCRQSDNGGCTSTRENCDSDICTDFCQIQ